MSTTTRISLEQRMLGEVEMVGRDRWEEIHRRAGTGTSIRAIARELDLDRKTVRRCLRQTEWRPYQRAARSDTLLSSHAEYLRRRASAVEYSAQVLFQELGQRGYRGSYETVKRFVRPLREARLHAAVTRTRFETPPGLHYVDSRVMLSVRGEADQGAWLAASWAPCTPHNPYRESSQARRSFESRRGLGPTRTGVPTRSKASRFIARSLRT